MIDHPEKLAQAILNFFLATSVLTLSFGGLERGCQTVENRQKIRNLEDRVEQLEEAKVVTCDGGCG